MTNGWLRPCVLSLSLVAGAVQAQVYTGTLGGMPVVVDLDMTNPEQVSGRYFYEKYHRDLALSGTLADDQLTLNEGLDDTSDTPRPRLQLQHASDDGWEGQWQKSGGKALKVQLKPAQVPDTAAGADPFWVQLHDNAPYDYLRLLQLPLVNGKRDTFMGYPLQWRGEPNSKIQLFEVASGYPEPQLTRVNQALRARLWSEVVSYHECMLGSTRFGEGEYDQTVTPTFLSPAVVSVSVYTSYYCGGAHPDFGDAPINFDVNHGKPLSLEDVLWVGEGPAFHYDDREGAQQSEEADVDFDKFSNYREKSLAPWLVAQFKQLYPNEMKKPADENDCDYSDPQVWNFPTWHFTDKGIAFGPSFARVARMCEGTEWSVLPYGVIAQHPGGVKLALPAN